MSYDDISICPKLLYPYNDPWYQCPIKCLLRCLGDFEIFLSVCHPWKLSFTVSMSSQMSQVMMSAISKICLSFNQRFVVVKSVRILLLQSSRTWSKEFLFGWFFFQKTLCYSFFRQWQNIKRFQSIFNVFLHHLNRSIELLL